LPPFEDTNCKPEAIVSLRQTRAIPIDIIDLQ
jgi:hypothetical protein